MPTEAQIQDFADLMRQTGASAEEIAKRVQGLRAEPMTAVEEIPPLHISCDRLTFRSRDKVVHIPLHELMDGGDAAAVALLLYGLVLKLQDIDASMRTLARVATEQQARAEQMTGGGAQKIVGDVVNHLKALGIFPPEAASAQARSLKGDGKAAG